MVRGALVTANYFRVLGSPIPFGRDFRDDEERRGAARVAVLSDGFWQRSSAAVPDAVGRQITLGGLPYTIVGVGARGLSVPQEVDIWAPLTDRHHPGPRGTTFSRWSAGSRPARGPGTGAGGVGDDRPAAGAASIRAATAAGASIWSDCRSASSARSGRRCWSSWARSGWSC